MQFSPKAIGLTRLILWQKPEFRDYSSWMECPKVADGSDPFANMKIIFNKWYGVDYDQLEAAWALALLGHIGRDAPRSRPGRPRIEALPRLTSGPAI